MSGGHDTHSRTRGTDSSLSVSDLDTADMDGPSTNEELVELTDDGLVALEKAVPCDAVAGERYGDRSPIDA